MSASSRVSDPQIRQPQFRRALFESKEQDLGAGRQLDGHIGHPEQPNTSERAKVRAISVDDPQFAVRRSRPQRRCASRQSTRQASCDWCGNLATSMENCQLTYEQSRGRRMEISGGPRIVRAPSRWQASWRQVPCGLPSDPYPSSLRPPQSSTKYLRKS
jgi:hypothetical protein